MPPRLPAILTASLLAPALGGTTHPGAIALVWCAMGLAILFSPPKQTPPRFLVLSAAALLAISLSAFLPAPSGLGPASIVEATWAKTRSPQPVISSEALLVFASTILWILNLSSQAWEPTERARAVETIAAALAALAIIALCSRRWSFTPPFWPSDVFGFFQNKNQCATLLSLASLLSCGLALRALPPSPKSPSNPVQWAWLAPLPAFLAALIIINSRAGIGILFTGLVAVSLCHYLLSKNRENTSLSISIALVLLAAFFVFGGNTLQRLRNSGDLSQDFRAAIQMDALDFSALHPWLGSGLGNFPELFSLHRSRSAAQNLALHPESDWLWAAGELGWPATLIMLGTILWWVRAAFPFSPGSDRKLRATIWIAASAFLLHGLVDVPAHRLGTVLPALLLVSLCVHPPQTKPSSPLVKKLWRIAGSALCLLGLGAAIESASAELHSRHPTPSPESLPWALPSQRIQRIQTCIQKASDQDDFEQIAALSRKALRISPLNWQYHFLEASASVQFPQPDTETAARAFAAARKLQPRWINICLEEGRLWLLAGEYEQALQAWTEALRRSKNSNVPYSSVLQSVLDQTGPRPELRLRLRPMVGSDPALLLLFLRSASQEEWEEETRALLEKDPGLQTFSASQRKKLFTFWYEYGHRPQLMALLEQNPDFHPEAWRCLALNAIDAGSHETACRMALRYSPPPTIPSLPPSSTLADLNSRFVQRPDDPTAGIALALAQQRAGIHRDALRTIERVQKLPNSPSYLGFIKFQIHGSLGQWDAAWRSWSGSDF